VGVPLKAEALYYHNLSKEKVVFFQMPVTRVQDTEKPLWKYYLFDLRSQAGASEVARELQQLTRVHFCDTFLHGLGQSP